MKHAITLEYYEKPNLQIIGVDKEATQNLLKKIYQIYRMICLSRSTRDPADQIEKTRSETHNATL